MAGPAPSPPSKDMAVPCVTSAWLARLHFSHSASLISAARDQHGGHGGFAGSQWSNGDGTVPIRKMVKKKLQLARKHFPKKYGENAHAHSGPQYTNASDLTSLPHNNLFHRTSGKQGPLMTWQPAWHHLPIMYIWALSQPIPLSTKAGKDPRWHPFLLRFAQLQYGGSERFLSTVTQEFVWDRFVPEDTDGFIPLTRVLRGLV